MLPSASRKAQELPRDGIDRQQMREAVQHDADRRFQGRRAFAVGDESNLALGIDAIDRAAFLVGDVERSRFIDIDVVQRLSRGSERTGCGEHVGFALAVDAPDTLAVGDEQPFAS